MKERILKNWTFARVIYLVMGLAVITESFLSRQWFGMAFGAYFASMGIFAFGCASGTCFSGNYTLKPTEKSTQSIQDVQYEEVKSSIAKPLT